jgi:hypothetical protein
LHFYEFSTIFYGFYKNQQNCHHYSRCTFHGGPWKFSYSYTYAPSLQIKPWEEGGGCNWVSKRRGWRGSPKSDGSSGALGQGMGLRGGGAHHDSVWAGVGIWKATSEVGQRSPTAAAVGAIFPVRRRPQRSN